MDRVGVLALSLALGLAVYGVVACVVGARKGRPLLVESARTSAYALFAMVAVANGAMVAAILADDFRLAYVAENSSRATPTFFKVLSLWSADEGSLLLWNLVLAAFVAAVAFRFRRTRPATFPYALAALYAVAVFYLALVLGPTQPFATLAQPVSDGRGPLPLLQNHPLMAAHPPFLYLGFVGFTVPMAFAVGSLVTGELSDRWIRLTRRWTLAAWVFLTVGLVLGALWSYGVLGWGGYWAWDPVENVALLPWLTATAFLHSVRIQERRGMLAVWNLSLVVGTFALATFGTFLTRGSILSSVHAFAQSLVGPMYLGFLALVLVGGFGLIAARSWRLASEDRISSPLSREAAFLGNNVALVTLTLVVLVGTLFPLVLEALTARQSSVGEPYFTQTTVPLFLLLLFLMGVGPLLPWRRADAREARERLAAPTMAGGGVMVALVLLGTRSPAAIAGFGLAAFVATANAGAIRRGMRAFRRATGRRGPASFGAPLLRNRRLYGGLLAHIGVAVAAAAITASSAFGRQAEVALDRGTEVQVAGYVLGYEGLRTIEQPHRHVLVADVLVSGNGSTGRMTPSVNLFPGASEPIGTPAIDYGLLRDVYVSVIGFDGEGERAMFRVHVNPGVTWLWVGGAVVALGGAFAGAPPWRRPAAAAAAPHRRRLERVR